MCIRDSFYSYSEVPILRFHFESSVEIISFPRQCAWIPYFVPVGLIFTVCGDVSSLSLIHILLSGCNGQKQIDSETVKTVKVEEQAHLQDDTVSPACKITIDYSYLAESDAADSICLLYTSRCV